MSDQRAEELAAIEHLLESVGQWSRPRGSWSASPHAPYEACDCPNPNPGRPWHCAAAAWANERDTRN